jgi:AbrB family looped-hinge helix DNA binding protein
MANPDRRSDMDRLVKGLPSVSAKIRALNAAGYARAEIARHLGKRYQHVRNVLEQETKKAPPSVASSASAPVPQIAMRLGPEGRIVIPAEYRRALNINEGDEVVVNLEGDSLRLISRETAIKRVQAELAQLIPASVSLVDDLIAERRREAALEERDG